MVYIVKSSKLFLYITIGITSLLSLEVKAQALDYYIKWPNDTVSIDYTVYKNKLTFLKDSLKIEIDIAPENIREYSKNGRVYKSFILPSKKDGQDKISFFAKRVLNDRVVLYVYNGAVMNKNEVYIFKKSFEKEFTLIEKNDHRISIVSLCSSTQSMGTTNGLLSGSKTDFYDEKPFLEFLQKYFYDCSLVANKLKNGDWYSGSNIEIIFEDYADCK